MALMQSVVSPRGFMALLALGLLGACGAGLPSLSASGLGGGAKTVSLDSVGRDKLQAFGKPIMRATIPRLGIDVLLSPREIQGDLVTWEAADGYTFTFRNGVLIETRGLGPDLMSAAVPSAGQIAGGGNTRRSYFYTWENDANQRRDYVCTTEAHGQQGVVIYGRSHSTRHVTENCQREGGKLTNEFWFESGTIRQSKQWISPVAGPGQFVLVID